MKPHTLLIPTLALPLLLMTTTAMADGDVEAGRQLYNDQMCNLCHRLAGEVGQMAQVGGPLDGVGEKRDESWIKRYIKDPKSVIPNSQMPATGLSDQQIADLTAFLLTH